MNAKPLILAAATCALFSTSVLAAPTDDTQTSAGGATTQTARRGNHPAEIAARLHATAGYDYASKFYLHPARLELYAEAPRTMIDHPAVIVARSIESSRCEARQPPLLDAVTAKGHPAIPPSK